ncbi:hypothetical protein D4764_06G0011980, partial [Takifugu flavidus]
MFNESDSFINIGFLTNKQMEHSSTELGVTGSAALYWVSIEIELRCLTRYPAATARLVSHNTVSSRYLTGWMFGILAVVPPTSDGCRPDHVQVVSVSFSPDDDVSTNRRR